MKILRNPELKGIFGLLGVILILGFIMAGMSGKLEQWFNISWFSGAKVYDKVVFVSNRAGTNELFSMNPDGSDQKQLTDKAYVISMPSVSPKANRIAFVGTSGKISQIMTVSAAGGNVTEVTSSAASKDQPEYSPDGKKLSYVISGKVFIADINGGNAEPVLPTHEEIHGAVSDVLERGQIPVYQAYAWGPNSDSLVGISRNQSGSDGLIYLPKLEGEAQPFPNPGQQMRVAGICWAANKPVFAASMVLGKNSLLIIFDAQQNKVVAAVPYRNLELGKPSLAPDASELVVPVISSNSKVPSGLQQLIFSSATKQMLAAGTFENPVYSPKGDRVLAVRTNEDDSKRDIVLIDTSTGNLKQLTKDGNSFNAVWTPASKK